MGNNISIIYYSRTGRTRLVAERLSQLLRANVEQISERKDRSGIIGYLSGGKDAVLKKDVELSSSPSVFGRKAIVLGMPVWGFGPPPAMRTWLRRTDLRDCAIFAFCTMDGSGDTRTFAEITKLLGKPLVSTLSLIKPNADSAEMESKLMDWARSIKESCDSK